MATFRHMVLVYGVLLGVIGMPVKGQSSTGQCTGPMIQNFNPCIGFLTSASNTSSPSSDCCDALRSLMSNGQQCLCQIITGGTSLQIPINRAMSLPRACKTSGVPIECKEAVPSPLPSPGSPGQGGSNTFPGMLTPPTGSGSINPPTPSSTTRGQQGGVVPTLTPPGMRPTLTLSAAQPSLDYIPTILVAIFGAIFLSCY